MASLQVAAPLVIAAGAVWPAVCGGMVALRFLIRKSQDGAYGPDDWLILPALLFLCGMCAAALSGAALHAVGYPTPPVPPEETLTATSREQTITRIVYWSVQCMQCVALTSIKLSALFFYRRIFGKTGRGSIDIALTAASIVRLAISVQTLNAEFLAGADSDFLSTDALYFQIIEVGLGLCAVCMPTLSGGLKLRRVQNLLQYLSRLRSFATTPPRSKSSGNVGKQGAAIGAMPAAKRTPKQKSSWRWFAGSTKSHHHDHAADVELEILPPDPQAHGDQSKLGVEAV